MGRIEVGMRKETAFGIRRTAQGENGRRWKKKKDEWPGKRGRKVLRYEAIGPIDIAVRYGLVDAGV